MADRHRAVAELELARAVVAQFLDQLGRAARARQRHLRILPGVRHAADAVVQLHQLVLAHDLLAVGVLRMRDHVLDHLEHVGIRRQREHRHHQPLDAGGDDEVVGRVLQVVQEVAVEERLALLGQPDHRVELRRRLVRQQRAQEVDVRRRRFHVDEEVGAREREQRGHQVRREKRRVEVELSARIAQDRHRQRRDARAVDDAADDVGALVAEEQRRQDLDLAIGFEVPGPPERFAAAMRFAHGTHDEPQVALDVFPAARQPDVDDDLAQRLAQARRGVVAAVGRRVRVHVVGRHAGPHEDELVAEVIPVQQLGAHRVEESLGALGLAVLGEQGDIVLLDRLPQRVAFRLVERGEVELALDARHRLEHALVVEVDALAGARAHALPVAVLVERLRLLCHVAKQPVVAVEAFQDGVRDACRRRHRAIEHDSGGDGGHDRYCD